MNSLTTGNFNSLTTWQKVATVIVLLAIVAFGIYAGITIEKRGW